MALLEQPAQLDLLDLLVPTEAQVQLALLDLQVALEQMA